MTKWWTHICLILFTKTNLHPLSLFLSHSFTRCEHIDEFDTWIGWLVVMTMKSHLPHNIIYVCRKKVPSKMPWEWRIDGGSKDEVVKHLPAAQAPPSVITVICIGPEWFIANARAIAKAKERKGNWSWRKHLRKSTASNIAIWFRHNGNKKGRQRKSKWTRKKQQYSGQYYMHWRV